MAYDYYWTGYEFTMDLEALNNLGITNVSIGQLFTEIQFDSLSG